MEWVATQPMRPAPANAEREDEVLVGRAAAERLTDEWPDISWVPEAPSEIWARAAVERFGELIREQRTIFRASQKKSERGAARLSARPFQGILESLQNADDQGGHELRIAVRGGGRRRELLLVHDGARVQLHHVGAMVLPWLTTKEDDPEASGRFGIGQKTLRALGDPLEVHCDPFEVRIEADGPISCDRVAAIPGFYAPERHDTLLLVPLFESVDLNALVAFIESLGSRSLLFLKSVRRLSMVDLQTGRRTIGHRLVADHRAEVSLRIGGNDLIGERLELRDPHSRQRYARYLVERPLSKREQRYDKASGETTPLGFALPLIRAEPGGFYDRLPMPLTSMFPFSLNAQFDPDAGRTTLLEGMEWNERRLADLGEVVVAAALDSFARDAASGWRAVPLAHEVSEEGGEWLADLLRSSIVIPAQQQIGDEIRLDVGNGPRDLSTLLYEDSSLDGLLTSEDQEKIRPGLFALPPASRDREGRWRAVLEELGRSIRLEVKEALSLFDQDDGELGERAPEWYLAMGRAALDTDVFSGVFLWKRSVLLADGRRVEAPGSNDPRSLVCRADPSSLAASLGVALQIHPAYLAGGDDAKRVAEALKDGGLLLDAFDSADAVLQVLARDYSRNTIGRVRIHDDQLLALRDAFERLDEEQQRDLGPRVGQNLELRGFSYDASNRRQDVWVSPADAYLPATIDRETYRFAKTAAQTPGLRWLEPSYARLLKRSGGRRELGAQRFLVRLGAATAPRLIRPENEHSPWKRDPRPASRVSEIERPELQMLEIQALSYSWDRYLLNDRWSPDLDAVIADICHDRNARRRRQRGLHLLGVLVRAWGHYAEHQHAVAVYGYDGYWLEPREVIATWLARAASESWLPSASGAMRREPARLWRQEEHVPGEGGHAHPPEPGAGGAALAPGTIRLGTCRPPGGAPRRAADAGRRERGEDRLPASRVSVSCRRAGAAD
jgi:hypothetical protein